MKGRGLAAGSQKMREEADARKLRAIQTSEGMYFSQQGTMLQLMVDRLSVPSPITVAEATTINLCRWQKTEVWDPDTKRIVKKRQARRFSGYQPRGIADPRRIRVPTPP